MKYRLDEPLTRGNKVKRYVWVERGYTENYLLIDIKSILSKAKK